MAAVTKPGMTEKHTTDRLQEAVHELLRGHRALLRRPLQRRHMARPWRFTTQTPMIDKRTSKPMVFHHRSRWRPISRRRSRRSGTRSEGPRTPRPPYRRGIDSYARRRADRLAMTVATASVGRRPGPVARRRRPAPPAARRRRPRRHRRRRPRLGPGAGRGDCAGAAAAGRQRHRRAAAHQPRPGARRPAAASAGYSNLELDLATGRRGSRHAHAGRAAGPGCAAPRPRSSSTTAPPPCCSCWPRWPRGREVAVVAAARAVEIGGGFRVPEVMAAVRAPAWSRSARPTAPAWPTTERAVARTDADVRCVLKVHPSNYRIVGFTERVDGGRAGRRSGRRWSSTSAPACSTPPARGWPAARRRGWAASRRPARPWPPAPPWSPSRGDKLLGGPQAGIIAGRARPGRPLRRATRWPGRCGPAAWCSRALQDVALAYLRPRRRRHPVLAAWRRIPVDELAAAGPSAARRAAKVVAERSAGVPGGGSLPGADDPVGRRRGRRRPHRRAAGRRSARSSPGWHDGAHDLRPAHRRPGDDDRGAPALRAPGSTATPPMHVVATAGHVDHGKSTLVLALTGIDPDRFAEEKRARPHDRPRLRLDARCRPAPDVAFVDVPGHVRFLKNMLAGVGAVDACLFVVAATEGWKPQSRSTCASSSCSASRHGLVALTKVDLVDDELAELADARGRRARGRHVPRQAAEVVPVDAPAGVGLDELRAALDRAACAATPTAADRGRPRLWVDRSFAAKGAGTVVTGTLTGGALAVDDELVVEPGARPVRVRALQTPAEAVERIGPATGSALNLGGVDHDAIWPRRRRRSGPGSGGPRPRVRRLAHARSARLDHDVSRRGAYLAYVGSGEHPVRVRVLGGDAIAPGGDGWRAAPDPGHAGPAAARRPLRAARERPGRDRRRRRGARRGAGAAGGKAPPDRSVERVVAERGWVDVDELEPLTGERRRARTLGRWVRGRRARSTRSVEAVGARSPRPGPLGLDVAGLDERPRGPSLARRRRRGRRTGRARRRRGRPPGRPPVPRRPRGGRRARRPPPDGVDRGELRELVRRGLVGRARRALLRRRGDRRGGRRRGRAAGRRPGRRHRGAAPRRPRRDAQVRPAAAGRARRHGASPGGGATCASPGRACPTCPRTATYASRRSQVVGPTAWRRLAVRGGGPARGPPRGRRLGAEAHRSRARGPAPPPRRW